MRYYWNYCEIVRTENDVDVWLVAIDNPNILPGTKIPNPDGERNDWSGWLEMKIGSIWRDTANQENVEFRIVEFLEEHLIYSFIETGGRHTRRGCGYDTFLKYFVPCGDDHPSYTEGYRSGCTGLRWL